MICPICGCTLTLKFFPRGHYYCPNCEHEEDTDDEVNEE